MQYALELAKGNNTRKYTKPEVVYMVGVNTQEPTREWLDKLFFASHPGHALVTGDIETSDLHYRRGRILTVGVTLDDKPDIGYCFFPHQIPLLKPYLESPELKWCWHNGKFDVQWFRHHYDIQARIDDDTMMMSYALDESAGVHGLKDLSSELLGSPDYEAALKPYLPTHKTSYAEVPLPILGKYQAYDTANTARVRQKLRKKVSEEPDLEGLYRNVLIPATEMLSQVEMNGFYIDQERVEENREYYTAQLEESQETLNEIAGKSFNAGSPGQVAGVMFDELGFPPIKKRSTDKAVLDKLLERPGFGEHPFIRNLLLHRKAVKMYGTYIKGLDKHMHDDGRVHPSFKVHGTRTGRLSCVDPPIQTIPRLKRLKGQFAAPPGRRIGEIDLSQGELRVLACVSKDPGLLKVFQNGEDIHLDLCLYLWGEWWDNWDTDERKERRVKAKNTNFGIPYGITKYGLAEQINDTHEAADRMLGGWDRKYPTARAFLNKCRSCAGTNRVITTPFGRKKRPVIVTKENRNFVENESANFPVQSICSDITLMGAVRSWGKLLEWGVMIVNLVHDSIILDMPEGDDDWYIKVFSYVRDNIVGVAEDYGLTQVPFVCDAEMGERWADGAKEISI